MPASSVSSKKKNSKPSGKKKEGSPSSKGRSGARPPPANKSRAAKSKSSNTNHGNNTNLSGAELVPPSKTLILIWLLVGGELSLDLFSTIVAFVAMLSDFECCGETVELGGLPLGITIPFFILVLIEIVMLLLSIKHNLYKTRAEADREEAASKTDESWSKFLGSTRRQKLINFMLVLNPFFGFMVAWLLLYQSNKKECFIVLGFEAGSLILHWLSIYFEGNPQTKFSLAFHAIPIVPFMATVIVILVSLQQGGVCYLVEQEYFWYKGCQICTGSIPLGERDECPEGGQGSLGQYCGTEENFCFFPY
jgi:hypothetical protein